MLCAASLRKQRSHSNCSAGSSFGCADGNRMWVNGGCRGFFRCANHSVPCGSMGASGYQECDCEPRTSEQAAESCRRTALWRPVLVNLGLPRTGTTSFAAASRRIGMAAAHGCVQTVRGLGTCLWEASGPEATCTQGTADGMGQVLAARSHDSLTDTPFFMLDRAKMERVHPRASLICTSRPREDWVGSMVAFQQNTSQVAGGFPFMWFMSRVIGRWPSSTRHGSIQAPEPDALRAYHDWHMNTTCGGLPQLRLTDTGSLRWATFCSAVPAVWRAACREAADAEGGVWPLELSRLTSLWRRGRLQASVN